MIYYDKIEKEMLHICDNQFKGCDDKIWQIGDKELCTDCAIGEVIDLDKAEQFLMGYIPSSYKDVNDLVNILSYVLSEDEMFDALINAYKDKKNSIVGHLECLNGLEECIRDSFEEEFLKSLGYKIIQEGF